MPGVGLDEDLLARTAGHDEVAARPVVDGDGGPEVPVALHGGRPGLVVLHHLDQELVPALFDRSTSPAGCCPRSPSCENTSSPFSQTLTPWDSPDFEFRFPPPS